MGLDMRSNDTIITTSGQILDLLTWVERALAKRIWDILIESTLIGFVLRQRLEQDLLLISQEATQWSDLQEHLYEVRYLHVHYESRSPNDYQTLEHSRLERLATCSICRRSLECPFYVFWQTRGEFDCHDPIEGEMRCQLCIRRLSVVVLACKVKGLRDEDLAVMTRMEVIRYVWNLGPTPIRPIPIVGYKHPTLKA